MTKKSGIYFAGHQQQSCLDVHPEKRTKVEDVQTRNSFYGTSKNKPSTFRRYSSVMLGQPTAWLIIEQDMGAGSLRNQGLESEHSEPKELGYEKHWVPYIRAFLRGYGSGIAMIPALSLLILSMFSGSPGRMVDDFNFSKIRSWCDRSEPRCSGKVRTKWV